MKKIVLINFLIILGIIIFLEVSARIYIGYKYGTQNAGLEMRTLYLKYEPYVMYGKEWKKVFLNHINELDIDALNVLLLGGSTAESFPVEILEKSLSKSLNQDVKVFNGAMGGYISSQEMVILTKYGYKLKPDLVINLNGANDLIHSIRTNNSPGTFHLNSTFELFITKPLFAPIIKTLQFSQLYNGLVRLKSRNIDYKIENYLEYVDIYLDNIVNMKIFSEGIGAEYFNILQPHVEFKEIKNKNEINFTSYDYRSEIVKELYEFVKNKSNSNDEIKEIFFDSTLIYEKNKEYIFTDDVHFVDNKGYEILSDFISMKVKDKLLN
jgi:lysophospholipase L1-like esterase